MVCCSLLGLDPDSRRSNIAFSVCAALNVSHLATPIRSETTTMAFAQIPRCISYAEIRLDRLRAPA